jgi:very-short-patch-repair endonuclease
LGNKRAANRVGCHHSEETKKKISFALMGNKSKLGQHPSEETRRKCSIGLKGKNLGKHPSAETRLKLSLVHKGKPTGRVGIHPSEETLKKLRLARIGKKPMLGKHLSEEARKKISAAGLGRKNWLGKHHSEETKKRISYTNKKNQKILDNLSKLHAMRYKTSKPQKELFFFLKQIFSDAALEYPIKTVETYRFADIGVPSLKIAFEFDGTYWHEKRKVEDTKRDAELAAVGWATFRIDERSLKTLSKQQIFAVVESRHV